MKLYLMAVVAGTLPGLAGAQVYHRGYVTNKGTYVAPHYQSAPNATVYDNWSVKPNVNPYTGQAGTKNPYGSPTFGVPNYGTQSKSPNPYGYGSSTSDDDSQ